MNRLSTAAWSLERTDPVDYQCPGCGEAVTAREAFRIGSSSSDAQGTLAACPECGSVELLKDRPDPSRPKPDETGALPDELRPVYKELTQLEATETPGAFLLLARQFFDQVARHCTAEQFPVDQGLMVLEDEGVLPPGARPWVDRIMQMGGQPWRSEPGQVLAIAQACKLLIDATVRHCFIDAARLQELESSRAGKG